MLIRLIKSTLAIAWYVFAGVTLLAAVTVTAVRLMLPGIGEYQDQIQQWVSAYMGQPVEIESIEAEWRGWRPQLYLKNISLLDADGTGRMAHFDHARISIDPINSVLRKELVPGHLTITGLQLSLTRNLDRSVVVEGLGEGDWSDPDGAISDLGTWLQQQNQLAIQQARVTWVDLQTMAEPLSFTDVSLQLRSAGDRLQLEGSARLPHSMGEGLDFALDAQGDLTTSDWSGELYIEGHGIHPGPWLRDIVKTNLDIAHGEIDLQVWTRWAGAKLRTIEGQFAIGSFELLFDSAGISFQEAKAQVAALRTTNDGWLINVTRLWVKTPHGAWPEDDIQLRITPLPETGQHRFTGSLRFLQLDDIAPFLARLPVLPPILRRYVLNAAPRGELRRIRFDYRPERKFDERLFLRAHFDDLIADAAADLPGINGLRGSVSGTFGGGELLLDADSLQLEFPKWFKVPLWLDRLEGKIHWTHDEDGWMVTSDLLTIDSEEINATLGGRLAWPGKNWIPTADLVVRFEDVRLEHIARYLPNTVSESDKQWVKDTIAAGWITEGQGVLRGQLDEFPFTEGQGRFEVRASISDGVLNFASGWPQVNDIEANITFKGQSVSFDATHARILNSEIVNVHGEIADVNAAKMLFKGHSTIIGPAKDVQTLIVQSPLASKAVGRQFSTMAFDGAITVDITMEVPLNSRGDYTVQGQVQGTGNSVSSERLGITITDLAGQLEFTEKRLFAEGLEGQLFGRPIQIDISTNYAGGKADTELLLIGTADGAFIADQLIQLESRLALFDERWVDGQTNWQARVRLPTDCCNPENPGQIRITSALEGMGINMPAPLGKAPYETRNSTIVTQISDLTRHDFTFHYSTIVSGKLELHEGPSGPAQNRISIQLGQGTPRLPDNPGLLVRGELAELALSPWLDFLHSHARNAKLSTISLQPETIDIEIGASKLEVFNQWFNDVSLKINHDRQQWVADIRGPEASGSITVPPDPSVAPVHVAFDYLKLDRVTSDEGRRRVDPRQLPALNAHCEALTYGTIELGEARLKTSPVNDGQRLDELVLTSPGVNISAQGDWLINNKEQRSQFDIAVQAEALGELLKQFEYDVTSIEGGETQLNIGAQWEGAPGDFSLATMDGVLYMNIGKGRFLDIDQGVGRVFGLLSFQTLARRLKLDFDDLYQEGFAFDRIEGTFNFENGNAYTNNLVLEGPSARMTITGRTGLATEDYDQVILVTPEFASSLPVASAFFGPVGLGVGAAILLAGQMFKSLPDQIDNVLSHEYTITGSWDDPTIERVNGKNQDTASTPPRFIDGLKK
ncbi:MAG: YhdP family protein [Gammaproteobacteria bacterium]|nr:YhdP family protein [Gammaproteobacteria bacterium]